jgi:hypothetical protein
VEPAASRTARRSSARTWSSGGPSPGRKSPALRLSRTIRRARATSLIARTAGVQILASSAHSGRPATTAIAAPSTGAHGRRTLLLDADASALSPMEERDQRRPGRSPPTTAGSAGWRRVGSSEQEGRGDRSPSVDFSISSGPGRRAACSRRRSQSRSRPAATGGTRPSTRVLSRSAARAHLAPARVASHSDYSTSASPFQRLVSTVLARGPGGEA